LYKVYQVGGNHLSMVFAAYFRVYKALQTPYLSFGIQ